MKYYITLFIVSYAFVMLILHLQTESRLARKNNKVAPLDSVAKVADSSLLPNLSVVSEWNHGATSDLAWEITCWRESRGDVFAYNKEEDAKGIAQIRPIMVDEVNRIIVADRIAGVRLFKHDDAYDPVKAREMFEIFQFHHCRNGTPEEQYAKWNSGP